MSYEYRSVDSSGMQALGAIYLIFIIGCLIFFFGGICALLCCCNQKFRGITRKGYIIRDAELSAPLMMPSGPVPGAHAPLNPYPAPPPTAPGWVAPNYPAPVDPPPKY